MPKAPRRSMRPMMRPDPEENTSRALSGELIRPMPRPAEMEELEAARRGERAARRGAQEFAEGGKVNGFAKGGMVTGTGSRAQVSGTKFSGTF
jgi:hypothetical protein